MTDTLAALVDHVRPLHLIGRGHERLVNVRAHGMDGRPQHAALGDSGVEIESDSLSNEMGWFAGISSALPIRPRYYADSPPLPPLSWDPGMDSSEKQPPALEHRILRAVVLVGGIVFVFSGIFVFISKLRSDPRWNDVILEHFAGTVGVVSAAVAALFVILVVGTTTEGPIEVKGLSFEFKGAAGPAILWALLLLAFSGAIWLLW